MMTDIIMQILILTVVLTLCGGAMLIFRGLFVKGSGWVLKRMWIVVLLMAIVPMYLLPITLPGDVRQKVIPADWAIIDEQSITQRWEARAGEQNTTAEQSETANVSDPDYGTAGDASPSASASTVKSAQDILYISEAMILGIWVMGAACFVAKCQYDKHRLIGGLRRFSAPCQDVTLCRTLKDCAGRVGITRPIQLMLVRTDIPPISPCVVGFWHPTLYIHASHVNDALQKEDIFVHELQHLRSVDALYKNFTCIILAFHWFNPLTYWIMPRIFEDCELSCDHRTLKTLGEERRIPYMKTILNIAATTQPPKKTGHAILFFCKPSGKRTMKRRYRNLSDTRLRPAARILALCLAVVMVFACVGCQLIGKKKNTLHLLTPLTEEMVRFYYGLSLEDEITQEMLDGVTSLHVYRDMTVVDAVRRADSEGKINAADELPFKGQRYTIEEIGDFIIVDFEVNYQEKEGESFAAARNQALSTTPIGCMNYIHRNYMENVILPKVQSEFEGYVDYNNKLNGEFRYKQFKAYWVLKDQNILKSERQKSEIIAAFPGCGVYPYYVFDPTANTEERMRAYIYYAHAGLLTNRIIDTDKIDPAIFDVFPNLTDLKITGLTEIKNQ